MLIAIAHAMAAPPGGAAGAQGQPSMIQSLIPLVVIFGIFYLLLIRPQQKKAKQHKAMLDSLKKGDQVVTSGGLYGTIFAITPAAVTLTIANNVKVKVGRSYISSLAGTDEASGG